MVERGNDVHRRILSQVTQLDGEMQEWTDTLCQSQGSSVPPSTLRETIDPYHSDSSDESDDFIEDPTTRGCIFQQDATTVIYRFAAGLQPKERTLRPLFDFEENRGGPRPSRAYCTISLPESPIHGISGSHPFSTSHARRAACFKACLELHKKGFLDYRLFPLPSRADIREEQQYGAIGDTTEYPSDDKAPSSSTVNVDGKSLGPHCYPRKKPEFWADTTRVSITYLYPIIISTSHSSDSPHAPMLMLTRQPLPPLENFKVFSSGIPAVVSLNPGAEFRLDDERLNDIYKYTLRVCRTIANKPFICALASMAYFFAPLGLTWKESPTNCWELPNVVDHIPWDLVSLAARSWTVELHSDDHGSLAKEIEDAVIQDRRGEFTRRYEAVTMRPDLTPLSKPMDSTVRRD
jgi:endoribonuclease Dicer